MTFKHGQRVSVLGKPGRFVNYIFSCGDKNGVDGCRVSVQFKGRAFWAVIPEDWVEEVVERCQD